MILVMSDIPLKLPDSRQIQYIDLSQLKISGCAGCFGCWTKTPGRCVIRDDAVKVYPLIAAADRVIYVSCVVYGGYDSVMKTMLERAIPVQQAFIRLVDGETHHVQRAVAKKQAVIVAYGAQSDREKKVFGSLVARNAKNMNFTDYRIIFTDEENAGLTAAKEAKRWTE